jgi:hypothetical protein
VITRQGRAVDDPSLSESTPGSDLPFGTPAAYWLDVRSYDPAAAAAASGKPVLLLQGGRDYQATVADDLPRCQAALTHRPDVTIRVYEADSHPFFPGSGPSSPAEFEPAQHLDPAVVADIADWLTLARHPRPAAATPGPASPSPPLGAQNRIFCAAQPRRSRHLTASAESAGTVAVLTDRSIRHRACNCLCIPVWRCR